MATLDQILVALQTLQNDLTTIVEQEALTFFADNFRRGGFSDTAFVKWKKGYKSAGATLVQGGHLRDSIQTISKTKTKVIVGSVGIVYAKMHNEGIDMVVTPQQRKFFWAMYYKFAGLSKTAKGKESEGQKGKRMNREAQKWRAMAMAKTIKMPKREFIGRSKILTANINKAISIHFQNLLKM